MVGALVTAVVLLLLISVTETSITGAVTVDASDVIAGSYDANGDATITLTTGPHWYNTSKSMTVVAATAAADTGAITIGTPRTSVTLTGSASTSQSESWTVTYVTESTVDANSNTIWKIVPFLLLLAVVGVLMVPILQGGFAASGRASAISIGSGAMVAVIGIFMASLFITFVGTARDAFTIAPDYIGITAGLTLVTIGYVVAILAPIAGALIPRARSGARGFG